MEWKHRESYYGLFLYVSSMFDLFFWTYGVDDVRYVGCYKLFNEGNAALKNSVSSGYGSVDKCISACITNRYTFAGQRGGHCRCDYTLVNYGRDESRCTFLCPENETQICGSFDQEWVSVFRAVIDSSHDIGCRRISWYTGPTKYDAGDVGACISWCISNRASNAALHDGGDCYCGASNYLSQDESKCTAACRGNKDQKCGAPSGDYYSLYKTGNNVAPSEGKSLPTNTVALIAVVVILCLIIMAGTTGVILWRKRLKKKESKPERQKPETKVTNGESDEYAEKAGDAVLSSIDTESTYGRNGDEYEYVACGIMKQNDSATDKSTPAVCENDAMAGDASHSYVYAPVMQVTKMDEANQYEGLNMADETHPAPSVYEQINNQF